MLDQSSRLCLIYSFIADFWDYFSKDCFGNQYCFIFLIISFFNWYLYYRWGQTPQLYILHNYFELLMDFIITLTALRTFTLVPANYLNFERLKLMTNFYFNLKFVFLHFSIYIILHQIIMPVNFLLKNS